MFNKQADPAVDGDVLIQKHALKLLLKFPAVKIAYLTNRFLPRILFLT